MRVASQSVAILVFAVFAALLVAPAQAANVAGETTFVRGSVTVERDGSVRTLQEREAVYVGDVIVTAERSRAQYRMTDGQRFSLRPNSRHRIVEYHVAGDPQTQPDGSLVVPATDSAVTELLEGALRSITGAIGRDRPEEYRLRTPVAELGIRGTDFTVAICDGGCKLAPELPVTGEVSDGLYVGVAEGSVSLRNAVGELPLDTGEYGYVASPDEEPVKLLAPPPALVDSASREAPPPSEDDEEAPPPPGAADGDTDADATQAAETTEASDEGETASAAGEAPAPPPPPASRSATAKLTGLVTADYHTRTDPLLDDAGGFGSAETSAAPVTVSAVEFDPAPEQDIVVTIDDEPVSITVPDPDPEPASDPGPPPPPDAVELRNVAFATAPLGSAQAFTAVASDPDAEVFTNGAGDLAGFAAAHPDDATSSNDNQYAVGSNVLLNTGFDPATELRWGRWARGVADITLAGGGAADQDLAQQSLHYVLGPAFEDAPALPASGSASYSLIAGNTDPTDSLGNVGVLGSASLTADFTNSAVSSEILLSIAGSIWEATGTGALNGAQFDGDYSQVAVDGVSTGSGSFSGFLAAPDPASAQPTLPAGAALTYGLSNAGVGVSGAVVFGAPVP